MELAVPAGRHIAGSTPQYSRLSEAAALSLLALRTGAVRDARLYPKERPVQSCERLSANSARTLLWNAEEAISLNRSG